MKWLFDNPWILVVVAGLVAQVLKAARNATSKGGADGESADAAEEAERTRRIREEIRRRIEARRGGQAPVAAEPVRPQVLRPSAEATPPPVMALPKAIREVLLPDLEPEPEPAPAVTMIAAAAELERQQALAQQWREATELKGMSDRRTAFEESTLDQAPIARAQARTTLLAEVRNPAALRRAILLREVLGPPVALR